MAVEGNTLRSLNRAMIQSQNHRPRLAVLKPKLNGSANRPSNRSLTSQNQMRTMSRIYMKKEKYDLAENYTRLAEHRASIDQIGTRTGGVAAVTKDSLSSNSNNFCSAASDRIFEVVWNSVAFPLTDRSRTAGMLLEGGARTAQTFRLGNDNDNYIALVYHVASMKAALKNTEPWIIDNSDEFECQWHMIERFIKAWCEGEYTSREKQNSGALIALELLEHAYAVEAALKGFPQRSFLFIWVKGMRQALMDPRIASDTDVHFGFCYQRKSDMLGTFRHVAPG